MRNEVIRRLALAATIFVVASIAEGGNCKFDTVPSSIIFGTYSPLGTTPVDTDISFSIQCSAKTDTWVELSRGSSATYAPRTMTSATSNPLQYNLYTAADRSVIFGNGTSGTARYADTYDPKNDRNNPIRIWGRIPAGMDVGSGPFTDTINVMLYEDGSLSATVPITVTAEVLSECTVESFNLNFGNYDPVVTNATTPLTAGTFVRAFCTKGTAASISLSLGANAAGSTRRMAGPLGEFLQYNIFTDASHTTIWDTTNVGSGTSASRTIPIGGATGVPGYGRIPAGQNVRAGTYTDTVVATVNY